MKSLPLRLLWRFLAIDAIICAAATMVLLLIDQTAGAARPGAVGESAVSPAGTVVLGIYFLAPFGGWAAAIATGLLIHRGNELDPLYGKERSTVRMLAPICAAALVLGIALSGARELAVERLSGRDAFGGRSAIPLENGSTRREGWVYLYNRLEREPAALQGAVALQRSGEAVNRVLFADRIAWEGEVPRVDDPVLWADRPGRGWVHVQVPGGLGSMGRPAVENSSRDWDPLSLFAIGARIRERPRDPVLGVFWHELWAYPLVHLSLALLGAAFIFRPPPLSPGAATLWAVFFCALYCVAGSYSRALGISGSIPPAVAIWSLPFLSSALSVLSLKRFQ